MREGNGELKKSGDALRREVKERKRPEVDAERELRDTRILHDLAMQFAADGDTQPLYDKILEAAVAIAYADAGTIQSLNEEAQELVLLATRNLPPRLTEKFARVGVGSQTSCGQALLTRQRTLIDFDDPDVPDPEGSCEMHVEAGLLSAQSTPLVTRSGRLIGMFTTHWRTHRRPPERELRFLDLLARQAADLIERRRAEEALRSSEARYRVLAEATSEGVVIHRQGKILEANPAAALMCGYELSDVVGMPLLEFVAPESRETLLSFVAAGREGMYDLVGLRKDGSTFPAEVTAKSFDYEGRPARLVLYRDITERKQMEEEVRRRLDEFTILHQASLDFSQLLFFEEVGQKIIDVLQHLPQWRRGSVWLVTEPEQELRLLAHSTMGLPPEALEAELARVRSLIPKPGEGISGWVALHGEPVRTGNVKSDPRYVEADPAMCSELCVPLKVGARTIGAINVESQEPDAFGEHDELFLTTLANTAAIAIENSRLFEKLQRELTERKRAANALSKQARRDALRADVSAAIAGADTPLRTLLQISAEAIVRHLGTAFARIWTLDREGRVLELQASAGLYTHLDGPHSRVPVGQLKIGHIAQERKPHLTNDVQTDDTVNDKEWARREGMVAFAGYPLIVEGRLVGVMAAFSRQTLDEDTIVALGSIADTIAQGIELRRVEAERLRLLRRLVNVQEEERSRVARDLHDRVSQYLATLRLHISALRAEAPADERLSQLDVVTAELAHEVTHLARELRPPALDEHGLEAALSDYVEGWASRFGRGTDFHANGLHGVRLPPDVETTVYRVVQEALTNVTKHSGAERVSVILQCDGGEVVAMVEDDGDGFDPEGVMNQPAGEKRLGLLGMRERAALVGGEVVVESAPGEGVTVRVRIPSRRIPNDP